MTVAMLIQTSAKYHYVPCFHTFCFIRPTRRMMATVRASLSHEERTAQEPREPRPEHVVLTRIKPVNQTIRLLRLSSLDPDHTLRFLPGQWLDVFLPGLHKAGGFTITSTPHEGRPTPDRPGYLELAIQKSENPPAKWLWQPEHDILQSRIIVRAGGSFTWPPPNLDETKIEQVVLIAGGVGINPLMSIFSHLLQQSRPPSSVRFVYTTKVETGPINGAQILFLERLVELIKKTKSCHVQLDLFLTGASPNQLSKATGLPSNVKGGRIAHANLDDALGEDIKLRESTVCYVCGPPIMTDEFVEYLGGREGMESNRVLCEKWW